MPTRTAAKLTLAAFATLSATTLFTTGCESTRNYNTQGQAITPPANIKPVRLHSADGTELAGWYIPGNHTPDQAQVAKRPIVIYFHGVKPNPAKNQQLTVDDALRMAKFITDAGVDVFSVDYRGFGSSQRSKDTTALAFAADAAAAVNYVRSRPDVDGERIVLFGHGIGGGLALAAAADANQSGNPVAGVVSVGAYSAWRYAANDRVPVLGLFATDGPNASDWIQQVGTTPVLVMHAKDDEVISVANADRLASAGRKGLRDVRLIEPDHGGHDALVVQEGPTQRTLLDFIIRRQAAGTIRQ